MSDLEQLLAEVREERDRLVGDLMDMKAEYAHREHEFMACSDEVKSLRSAVMQLSAAVPMLFTCPVCHTRHIDRGVYATKPHRTHVCLSCGMMWRPALVHTVGVDFLPGYGPPSPNDDDSHVRGLWTHKATGQVFEVIGWALRGVVPGDNVYMRPVGADEPLHMKSLETLRQEYLRTTEPAK